MISYKPTGRVCHFFYLASMKSATKVFLIRFFFLYNPLAIVDTHFKSKIFQFISSCNCLICLQSNALWKECEGEETPPPKQAAGIALYQLLISIERWLFV